jgi:16S rRNA (guanine966-N2)-methyltransferase
VRIIAGSARGTRLAPVPAGTRPLSDRAREGLFSSLGDRVLGARVLDLFAGTGAIGIEALSRGAREATFVDRAHRAVATIHANLERTKLDDRAMVVRSDWDSFLDREARQFDLVFLDPPHGDPDEEIWAVLSDLEGGWLGAGFTVAVTRARRDYSLGISVDWRIAKRLEYGDTVIVLYREV